MTYTSKPRLPNEPTAQRESPEAQLPRLTISEEQQLRGEALHDELDDDDEPADGWRACEACGNDTCHTHEWGNRLVCTSCFRQLNCPLDEPVDTASDTRNGPITTSFDRQLWLHAPVYGRALRDYEVIPQETIDGWIDLLKHPDDDPWS